MTEACRVCNSERREMTRRRVAGGSIQIVDQCSFCGAAVSLAYKASTIKHPERLPEFDEGRIRLFEMSRHAKRDKERQAWLAEHDIYLRTPEWRSRRQAVLYRARGKCEGCGIADATQVHHLTYEHWKNEFLWELVAICDGCHTRIHHKETP